MTGRMPSMKLCVRCKTERPHADFSKDKNRKDGLYVYCKMCMRLWSREFRLKKPNSAKHSEIKYKYGLTLEEYNLKLVDQGNCCAICGTDVPGGGHENLYVDHNHDTGKVRGLLCRNCNLMIGHAKDNKDILESAIKYLTRWDES